MGSKAHRDDVWIIGEGCGSLGLGMYNRDEALRNGK